MAATESISASGNLKPQISQANPVIWREILKNLEIWTDEDPVDLKQNRLSVLSIALLSSSLSGIALEILWKNMSSLEPLVCVFNAFSPPDQPCLSFVEQYWTLSRPFDVPKQRERALQYLRWVQNCRFESITPRDTGLWAILSTSLGLGRNLLPSLSSVSFRSGLSPLISFLHFFQSPSVQSISFSSRSDADLDALLTIQNLLLSGDTAFQIHFSYHGQAYPALPTVVGGFSRFNGLRSLKLLGIDGLSITNMAFPTNDFENLEELVLDLALLTGKLDRSISPARLQKLNMRGSFPEITEFLRWSQLPSLTSMSVSVSRNSIVAVNETFRATTNGLWMIFLPLTMIMTQQQPPSSPNLRHFSLNLSSQNLVEVPDSQQQYIPPIHLGILSRLRNDMESIILTDIPYTLTIHDFTHFIKSQQSLRVLSISDRSTSSCYNGVVLKVIAENLPNLSHLRLHIDFQTLCSDFLRREVRPFRNQLQELDVPVTANLPEESREQIVTVFNLLSLFPLLKKITIGGTGDITSILQKQVKFVRHLLADDLQRRRL